MDIDSKLLQESIPRLPAIRGLDIDLKDDIAELCTDAISAVVPFFSVISPIKNAYGHYKERRFAKRAIIFLYDLAKSEIPQEKIDEFIKELSSHACEDGYDTITGMIDRLDNENKAWILSNLVRFCAEGRYPTSDFFRLANSLERVPFSDLNNLSHYRHDYYASGETEMLATAGLVSQTVLDLGVYGDDGQLDKERSGSRYGLSRLGELMLQYGFANREYSYEGRGPKINIPTISPDEIHEMFDKTHGEDVEA